MTKINKRIQALKTAAQTKRQTTIDKVNKTLAKMRDEQLPINFGSVARLAGVSKTWLYKQTDLAMEIASARIGNGVIKRVQDQSNIVQMQKNEIIRLKTKQAELKDIIKKLRKQLEVVYGELYKRTSR